MPSATYAPVKGKLLRVTKLGPCGDPIFDPNDPTWPVHAVAKCFATVEYSPEVDDGEEIDERDANGDACVTVPPCPSIKWMNVTIALQRVDPELYSMLTGVPVVLDADANATGFRIQRKVNCDSGVAFEVWTGTQADTRCVGGGQPRPRFGYFLIPFLTNAIIGDFTVQNGAATFSISGKGVAGGAWGLGPYPVYETAAGGVAALADPIGEEDLLHGDVTTLAPPPVTAGVVAAPHDFILTRLAGDESGLSVNLAMTYVPAGPPPHPSTVDWGDRSTAAGPAAVGGPGVDHRYAAAGTYQVRVADEVTGAVRLKTVTVPAA